MSVKKQFPSRFQDKHCRGMVLILVLWSLFFLGALALAIAAYVRPQLELALRLKNSAVLRALTEAGVKRAMTQISLNGTGQGSYVKADTLTEFVPGPWFDFKAQGLADGQFNYALVDEERKININTASENVLTNFFVIMAQFGPQQADDMAAAILDWRQPGENPRKNGAKSSYYQTLSPSYPCKDGPFDVLEELLLVKGMTPDIFKSIKGEITVYGAGAVNINTADISVLETLGMSTALANQIINFRNGSNIFTDPGNIVNALQSYQPLAQADSDQLSGIVGAGLLCVRSDNFRGTSYGKITRESLAVDFVFTRNAGIRFWREE